MRGWRRAGLAGWLLACPLWAESDIIVTGSRLVRPDLAPLNPVSLIDREEIARRQPYTAEDLLHDLPAARPNLGKAVNNGSDGSAAIDLRGLGAGRTLVLIDGRRIVPFGLDGLVDLNVVPTALIERVDVVTAGASAVYGADAVAGVVNFITRRDFSGLDLSAHYRLTGRGDARDHRADLVAGSDWAGGRGHVVIGLGYGDRAGLPATDRAIATFPVSSSNGLFSGSPAGVPVILTAPSPAALGAGSSVIGATILDVASGRLVAATQGDQFNSNIGTYFQTPLRRYSAYASGRYALGGGSELYAKGQFARNEAAIQLASSGSFTSIYQLPLSNPYLPAGARQQLCASIDTDPRATGIQPPGAGACAAAFAAGGPGSPGYLEVPVVAQRRFTEYGPRRILVASDQFQIESGLRGALAGLRYDVSAQYGETGQRQRRENWGSYSRVQQALRAYRDGSGRAVCADGANGCVPIDLFGAEGSITPDMLGFIDLDPVVRRRVTQAVASATAGGDVPFLASPLAARPAAFSIGAEYRRLTAMARPDAASQLTGEVLGVGARTPPDRGRIAAREAFGELAVPLADRVEIEAGLRYSDQGRARRGLTWKAGGGIEPIRGLRLRGLYQAAVRAPNLQELYASPLQSLGVLIVDPCQGALPLANAALAALCRATGAPASAIGSIPGPASFIAQTSLAGNPDLGVEKARTLTLGGTLAPPGLPGLSLAVDYHRIRVRDAISRAGVSDIVDGCYSAALNPTLAYNDFCRLIGRNPLTGGLNGGAETAGVILLSSNLGRIDEAGIDVAFGYRRGPLSLKAEGSRLGHYHFQATPGTINRDCTGYYSSDCGNPRPRWKWNARASFGRERFDLSVLWRHIGRVALEPYSASPLQPLSTPQPGGPNPAATSFSTIILDGVSYANQPANGVLPAFRRIGAYDYFDLSGSIRPAGGLEIGLLIENLFDRAPPLVGSSVGGAVFNSGNTFPTVYDVLGRAFSLTARLRF